MAARAVTEAFLVSDVPSNVRKPIAVRRRGRTAGTAVFAVLISSFTAVCSIEIIVQAWSPSGVDRGVGCRPGILGLIGAVRRAREAAVQVSSGEREAVLRFRRALEPEWSDRPAIGERCRADPESTRALGELDRLRYGEEHALRYEALDIADLRRKVLAEERLLEGATGTRPPAPP